MSIKAIPIAVAVALAGGSLLPSTAFSAVGEQVNKSMSQNVIVPDEVIGKLPEADHSFIKYLRFYVPAQAADGTLADTDLDGGLGVSYNAIDGTEVKERPGAKPLIGAFGYGDVEDLDTSGDTLDNGGGFAGHGYRDAFGAVSLDDGHSWKASNLSESASQAISGTSSEGTAFTYPAGDVVNVVHATAGRRAVVAWQSRYCQTGSPAYALDDTSSPTKAAVETELGIDSTVDLYLTDLFGVAGSQDAVDYAAQGYESVGTVPFNCLWTARGVLVEGDDPRTAELELNHMVWFKPERLTSGRRDVNRIEISMVADAGAAIIWQEDPDGLLPGRGLGPGEGWSGAIANNQTDVWYSFLPWDKFERVDDGTGTGTVTDLATYWDGVQTEKPQHFVPFAVPMRLTNNAKCDPAGDTDGYCDVAIAVPYGLKDQCADTTTIPQGQNDQPGDICVSENGLPNVANTAATRARLSLQPRDIDGDGTTDSAWVVVISEESKGFGRFGFRVGEEGVDTATPCDVDTVDTDDTCEIADDGKNIWYYSFDMGKPQTSADTSETSLVANLVSQGNLINQPESDWRTGEIFPPMDTTDMWNFISNGSSADLNFDIYRTEIARRGSLMVQPLSNLGGTDLTALLLFKQGLLNQGGPADIMARRVINAGAVNPYDFTNIVCEQTLFTDGSNPYYPKGICMDPAINMSGTTPQTCDTGGGGDNDVSDGACPTVDADNVASDDPTDQTTFDKVTTWIQCPGSPECGNNDLSTALGSNFDDQSWYNPLEVSKGHRGYIWGDMAVVMYAWSPNWKLNTTGSDRYELYIRRSFDGGQTWTTTPVTWGGTGTATCETMRDGETASAQSQVCVTYAAGADEQARNVSQLRSLELLTPTNKFTILDPRYAPDPPTMPTIEDATYDDAYSDVFNPSRFFVVFETGDNTTVAVGEAEPLDLNYGRAINFGDHYQVWTDEADLIGACTAAFCNEFERLNVGGDTTGSEASLAMTPAGDTLYSVWSQHNEATGESDAQYARIWYDDPNVFTLPPDAPATDEPVIGDGGTYTPPSNGGTTPPNGGNGGCSVGNASSAFDPLLPGLVLAALGYLGLRRRMGRFH